MSLLTPLQYPAQIRQTDSKGASIDRKVVHENFHYVLNKVSENRHHAALERRRCIAQSKRHSAICISAIWTCECRLLLVVWVDGDLKET
ncbi:unnamed protein product [Microthlaspi erraticum]|uniref:Uncharacterized protein n=1 Tax=Microthlaspi erraticum TaxID=1685480 RepID=A0A6D2HFL2_9BRAS|nr:unnamed protein product [Microthlaspi erraticum]